MAITLGKVKVDDLVQNNYKVLGIGINQRSQNNGIFVVNYTTLSQAKHNLRNLILTKKGERLMQPEFGSDLYKCLFEPNAKSLETKIDQSITDAVNTWMPYVNIESITYDSSNDNKDRNRLDLELKYSLKFSNSETLQQLNITL